MFDRVLNTHLKYGALQKNSDCKNFVFGQVLSLENYVKLLFRERVVISSKT